MDEWIQKLQFRWHSPHSSWRGRVSSWSRDHTDVFVTRGPAPPTRSRSKSPVTLSRSPDPAFFQTKRTSTQTRTHNHWIWQFSCLGLCRTWMICNVSSAAFHRRHCHLSSFQGCRRLSCWLSWRICTWSWWRWWQWGWGWGGWRQFRQESPGME